MWKFVLYQKAPPFMGELSNEVRLRGNISRHLPAPSYSPFNCSLHSQPQRWLEYGRLASLPLAILPIPPDSPLAASSTGRAQLRNVAGQLRGSRPWKIENNRMAKKKNSPFGLFFSLVSGSYLQLILPYRSH